MQVIRLSQVTLLLHIQINSFSDGWGTKFFESESFLSLTTTQGVSWNIPQMIETLEVIFNKWCLILFT